MVTGASSGIGRATAAHLADAGHVVFAAARREAALTSLAEEHSSIRPIVLDVTDHRSIAHAHEQVQSATDGHGLDALVNAAGVMILGPVEAVPNELIRKQFDVNLFGLLDVTKAFVPDMRARGAGRIVNVSSILGRFVLPGSGLYSATKFATEAASDALRMELAPYGVSVVLVEPGVTDTPLYDGASESLSDYDQNLNPYRATFGDGFRFPEQLLKKAASVEVVAAGIANATLTRRPRARYVLGLGNRVNTRLLTRLPTRAADRTKVRIAGATTSPRFDLDRPPAGRDGEPPSEDTAKAS
jgi:NADP-dependent 3-hydroxy acid dehydrogenase YdfG